jgi:drug/metabolite transporter (DMT)-like permease
MTRKSKGIALAFSSVFFLALGYVIAKLISGHYHPIVINFFRSVIMLGLILVWVVATKKLPLLKTERPYAQLSRGLVGNIGQIVVVTAYAALPVSNVSAVLGTSPLIAVCLALVFLKEPVHLKTALALGVGFIGALFIIQPSDMLKGADLLLALAASGAIAVQTIIVRYLGKTDQAVTTVFYTALIGTVIGIAFLPFLWNGWVADLWWLVGLTGLVALAAQIMRTETLRLIPVSLTECLGYGFFLWSILLGFLIFHDVPGLPIIIGSLIVLASNVYIVWQQKAAD